MKLYISCDMEGIAGVCSWDQVEMEHPEFAFYRQVMTREVRAAIEGAREALLMEVLINDSHGKMYNLDLNGLPDDVRVIFGNRKPFSMVQGIDETFAGAFFTGYHGAIGGYKCDALPYLHTIAHSQCHDKRHALQ